MENEGEERQREGEGERRLLQCFLLSEERESCFLVFKRLFPLFLLFYSSSATCPYLIGAKRAHFLFLTVTHTQSQK